AAVQNLEKRYILRESCAIFHSASDWATKGGTSPGSNPGGRFKNPFFNRGCQGWGTISEYCNFRVVCQNLERKLLCFGGNSCYHAFHKAIWIPKRGNLKGLLSERWGPKPFLTARANGA
ncbi:MAG: hypothetical protein WA228_07230, partial [Desulfobaccales bacterium]